MQSIFCVFHLDCIHQYFHNYRVLTKHFWFFQLANEFFFLHINKFYQNTRWFIRLSNVIVFQKPEPSILSILYGWSRIWDQFGLCLIVFFPVTSTKLISSYTYCLECQDIEWIFFFRNFLTFFCFNVRI